jgi:hypothetical protein
MLFSLEEPAILPYWNRKSQYGGRTRTRKNKGRGAFVRGWAKQQPGTHERTLIIKRCGQKCFLGPNKSFPICTRGTCKINRKGVYAAYIRARQYKHRAVSAKARKLLGRKN